MEMASDRILDLGDYTSFSLQRCLKDKTETMILDEGGLYSPLSVSLIIPTRFGSEEGREIERETLKKILSECSELVDAGYLDEIVVIDATRDKDGNPDFRVLQNVVRVAYEELGLFREQVNLLNKYGSENEKGKRGLTDFFIKVIHQFDENIPKVLAKFGVFGVTGVFGVPPGKGAALWLSIPVTEGDILCFVDSDILNFKKEFVTALCHPIVYSWNVREAATKFVKAYYTRLTKTPDLSSEEAILGGRVCRLFATPLIQSVTSSLELYTPLRMIKYPLAGEFALSRDTIEKLDLTSAYSVEMHVLFQLLDLIGSESMAQVDLQVYNHIGQEFLKLENLARQIGTCILERITEKRKKPLTNKENKQILHLYQENANQIIENSKELISKLEESAELKVPYKLVYSKEEDEKHLQRLLKVLENILSKKVRHKIIMLPSWSQIRDTTGNYFILREMLRRRSNQSTWSRLKECGLISRPQPLER
jgi:hypothetical protein